jgi:hypothetical protein
LVPILVEAQPPLNILLLLEVAQVEEQLIFRVAAALVV